MQKHVVKIIFTVVCLLIVLDAFESRLCSKEPRCYCTTYKTGLTKIYCENVFNVLSIDEVLKNYTRVYSLRIYGKYLTSLPSKVFAKRFIKILEISGPLKNLPDDALSSIRDLEIVNFNGTEFLNLQKGLAQPTFRILEVTHGLLSGIDNQLQNMSTTTDFLFNNNKISKISSTAFSNTISLQNLDLSNNLLEFLDSFVFHDIPYLKKLNLANNKLQTMDGILANLNLETLILYGNNLNHVKKVFHPGMWSMKWLDLGGNPNLNLSGDDFNGSMIHLSTFSLNNNNFENLDSSLLSNFIRLDTLYLNGNNLTQIPTDFFLHNLNLKTIEISNNNLRSIKDLISFSDFNASHAMRGLKKVLLNGNNIISIELDESFKRVLHLDLSQNHIDIIRKNDLQSLVSVTSLNLSHNPLSEIETESFVNQPKLLTLDLSYSRLTTLNHSIQNLSDLSHLKITSSLLESLEGELEGLKKLKYAYFSDNYIASVYEVFKNIPNLTTLDISRNNLTTMAADSFAANENKGIALTRLWIADNPWSCDCRLLWFLDWLREKHSKLEDEPLCRSPANLRSVPIRELNQSSLEQWIQDCPESCECKCSSAGENISTSVNCVSKYLTTQPSNFPKNSKSIDLSDNKITSFTGFSTAEYSELQILKMENNDLKEIQIELTSIISLYLARNNLSTIPFKEWNHTVFKQVSLSMNPWICECETWDFRQWLLLHNSSIQDLHEIRCGDKGKFDNQIIIELSHEDLCPNSSKNGITIIITVCAVVLLFLCLFLYFFGKLLAVLLYSCGFSCLKREEQQHYLFDAFLLYADEDDEFAIGKIAEGLESDPAIYKLFVPTRQVLLTSSPVNINSSIADCAKVIVVLTSNLLRNSQCMRLLKTAMACSIQNTSRRFIFITKDGLPAELQLDSILSAVVKKSVCLKWGDLLFWSKIKFSLPKRRKTVSHGKEDSERLIQ